MASSEVKRLRQLARERQRAAGNKISRYKKQNIKIAGSDVDPRRDLKKVDKYNSKQLKAYINELNAFTDRTNQFVRGARGVPISKGIFEAYKVLEKRYNNHFQSEFDKIKDVKLPGRSMTFGERHEQILPKKKSLRAGTSKYFGKDRVSSGFTSDAAIKKSMQNLRKSMKPGFTPDVEKQRRDNFVKLIKYSNRDDLYMAVQGGVSTDKDGNPIIIPKLTNEEFYILWEYDSVIQNIVEEYYITIELLSDEDNAIEHSGGNALFDEILTTIEEIKSSKSLRGRLRNNGRRK